VKQTLVMFVGEFLCLLVLYLSRLVRRLVPDNQKAAKYAALPTYDAEAAGDSGVVLSGSYAIEGAVAIKPGHNPPVGAHGPLPAPTAIVLDEIELAEVEDVLTWRQTCLFAIPTLCDLTGTTLMNLGLVLTPVSVFQMLRGALVLWVGLFSVLFLKRRLTGSQWASLFVVMLGVAVVGLSSTSGAPAAEGDEEGRDADRGLLGICLILFAQILCVPSQVAKLP
jgi:drug/metabolite transporter (DMT)-like permease